MDKEFGAITKIVNCRKYIYIEIKVTKFNPNPSQHIKQLLSPYFYNFSVQANLLSVKGKRKNVSQKKCTKMPVFL